MKKFIFSLLISSLFTTWTQAATVAINGVYGFNAVGNSGGNLAANSLVMVVVDTGGDGFLNSASSPSPISSGASLTVGSLLGNDLIVGRFGATNTGNATFDTLLTGSVSFDVDVGSTAAADTGMQFALVWFDGATISTNTSADGMFYQFGRGNDWILPAAPATRIMGTNFTQLGSSAGASAGQTTFAIGAIPEPSRLMLLGFGLMGLFFRRRR